MSLLILSGHVSRWYSGFHLFYAKLWTVADQNPLVKKTWKIGKIMPGWFALLPKIKKRTKTLRDPTIITFPHFLRTLEGVSTSHQMCPVMSGRVDNRVRVGQRPYACLTISGSGVRCAANVRHYRWLHFLFPWCKRSRSVVSSHFRLILSQEIMVPGPSSFFCFNKLVNVFSL